MKCLLTQFILSTVMLCPAAASAFGAPLYNGTVFKTLPGSRTFVYQVTQGTLWASIGDFIDLDHDGDLDYVVAFSSFQNGQNNLQGCKASGFYTYRATYINQGHGWTMNACESNMDANTFNTCFPFLIVPCP